jgi:hypothetical protein
LRSWPIEKKLEKLAIYSACKVGDDCKCNGKFKHNMNWPNLTQPSNILDKIRHNDIGHF